MSLRAAVYLAPGVPFASTPLGKGGIWSPTSCTLIYSDKEAVLVDTPVTIKLTEGLVAWIEKIAPGRQVSYIYITHGHGDHFLGLPLLLKRWPNAKAVATAGTVAHAIENIPPKSNMWESLFPGQIAEPAIIPTALSDNFFLLEDRWRMEAIECGHSDTKDTTALWVPDLRLAVCGDIVYGSVHQMLAVANTPEKRKEWIEGVKNDQST